MVNAIMVGIMIIGIILLGVEWFTKRYRIDNYEKVILTLSLCIMFILSSSYL